MISKCANPDCQVSFDYREGRFFRFHRRYALNEAPPNAHSVWHSWLCQRCSELYTLEVRNESIRLSLRLCHRPGSTSPAYSSVML
jgi:hypothetical protein